MSLDKILKNQFDEYKKELEKQGQPDVVVRGVLTYAKLLARGVIIAKGLGYLTNYSTNSDKATQVSKKLLDELAGIISIAISNYEKSHDLTEEQGEFIINQGKKINNAMTDLFEKETEKEKAKAKEDPKKTLQSTIGDFLKELEKIDGVEVIRI